MDYKLDFDYLLKQLEPTKKEAAWTDNPDEHGGYKPTEEQVDFWNRPRGTHESEPEDTQEDKLDYLVNVMSTSLYKALQSFEEDGEGMNGLSSEDIDYLLNKLREEIR